MMQAVKILVPVSNLTGSLLDYAVALAENNHPQLVDINRYRQCLHEVETGWWIYGDEKYTPSSDWSIGGPLMDQMREANGFLMIESYAKVTEVIYQNSNGDEYRALGDTILEAAMRVLVFSKLGSMVNIPKDLLDHLKAKE